MLSRRNNWLPGLVLLGPAAIWVLLTIVAPVLMVLRLSVQEMSGFDLEPTWTLANFEEILSRDIFLQALKNSLRNGVITSIAAVLISVPLAHFIRFRVRKHKALLLGMIVIALWTGYLLRIFGWRIALGNEGIINSFLIWTGLVDEPVSFFVFSTFGVILAQTHLTIAFAFIPIYAVMERVPASALMAAADLGASRIRSFFTVELPLIAPGVLMGGTFAFILAFGDFFAPTFVGSPSAKTLGNVAADNFREIINWPVGAAAGVVMMIVVLAILLTMAYGQKLISKRNERAAQGLG